MESAFVHSAEMETYDYPPDCPFNTRRAGRTRSLLLSMGLLGTEGRVEVRPEPAERSDLERLHTPAYLDALREAAGGRLSPAAFCMGIGTPDCPVFPGMYDYARWACGATLTAARLVLGREARVAFNPSGGYHHAHREQAAGFCYVNDVALACMLLAQAGMRVVYLDVDVHHADGVQEAFYARDDVMTISLHESGRTLFPGTGFESEIGEGRGRGYSVNVPFPPGTYDEAYLRAFHGLAVPLIEAFGPDAIVLELGMDALAGDPLAHLRLTNNAYAEIASRVLAFGKPIVATGGGGYHVENTVRGWALAWSTLCGADGADDLHVGLGGVLLETTEWHGGLRDRVLAVSDEQRRTVEPAVAATIAAIRRDVFPLHGL